MTMLRRITHALVGTTSLLLVAATFGCAHRLHDFSLVSTKPLVIENVDLDALPSERVAAEGDLWFFLFIPLGGRPQPPEIIEEALAEHGADLLLNAEVCSSAWTALLVSRISLRVAGEAVTLEEKQ